MARRVVHDLHLLEGGSAVTPLEASAVLLRANAAISSAAIGDRQSTDKQWRALLEFVANQTAKTASDG